MNYPDSVIGDQLGLPFPTTIEPLLDQGVDFLTKAFQATNALAKDNRVIAITSSKEFFGGGMGRKLLLSVEYEKPAKGLHKDLFVKLPRMFGDPLRDLFGPLMEPEVRFALLSRRDGFPITVPKCYFADYDSKTKSGILITERIAYGQGTIEPCAEKCLDYNLADPLAHYRAMTRAMARLAGFHKSGKFGADTDRQFPFDAKKIDIGSRIPYTPEQLRGKLDKLRSFAATNPQLFPGTLGSSEFLERFVQEAPLVLLHELAIRTFLNEAADFIALCHWNMNLDNAWFWTDESGTLQAGLLDWGSVGQMNVAQAFYGMTCAAEIDFLNAHRRDLMALFVGEYRRNGGPAIDIDELAFMVKLSVAVLGIAWILDAPTLTEAQIPDIHTVKNRYDPKLKNDFLAHAQIHLLIVMLNEWQADDIGAALRDFAARNSHGRD
jgi:hypothetical protein